MSKVFIKGVITDVGAEGGADEIIRLRELLIRRNTTIRKLKIALKEAEPKLEALRIAICLYMKSEGCSCCRDDEAHDKYQREIANLLQIPLYKDGSGVDYFSAIKQYQREQTK